MGVRFVTYRDTNRLAIPAGDETCPCCGVSLWDAEEVFHVANAERCEDRLDGNEPGWYRGEYVRDGLSLSYGGYSALREQISDLAIGVPPETIWNASDIYAGRPFVPLIHYSDCEGAIGPETCQRLAADFAEHEAKAEVALDEGWLGAYRKLAANFTAAGSHGWVLLR